MREERLTLTVTVTVTVDTRGDKTARNECEKVTGLNHSDTGLEGSDDAEEED